MSSETILNAFTVDVEDYFHVQSFTDQIDRRQWDDYESRVVANTHRILRLLDAQQVRGTFFVLGWVAERFPQLVRDIQRSGHQVGSHSFWHRLIYEMTPEAFRADLRQTRQVLEDIVGEPVVAFRAPSFSITAKSLWALEILVEEGIVYDSSIFPIYHDTYGIPNAERFPHRIPSARGVLWEFPPTVHRLGNVNVPVSGGGYFRLYPRQLTAHWLRARNRRDHQPFVFYIHPWELDPEQPRIACGWRSRFRHYQNLRTTESKLAYLLRQFRFGTIGEAIQEQATRVEGATGAEASAAAGQPAVNGRGRG